MCHALISECFHNFLTKKLPSIEVRPTALAWPMTLTLTVNPLWAMVMNAWPTRTHKYKSVPKIEWKQTDGDDWITSHANAVITTNSHFITCMILTYRQPHQPKRKVSIMLIKHLINSYTFFKKKKKNLFSTNTNNITRDKMIMTC